MKTFGFALKVDSGPLASQFKIWIISIRKSGSRNFPYLASKPQHMARTTSQFHFRPIHPDDNATVAHIIRTVMTEFGCVGEGYSINDPEVDDMAGAYAKTGSVFLVLEIEGEIVGCGGIAPLAGGDATTCELRKMYFLPEARGKGLGRKLLDLCLTKARQLGYEKCYLETVARMDKANRLYQQAGFQVLDTPLGDTGHCSCDAHYVKVL